MKLAVDMGPGVRSVALHDTIVLLRGTEASMVMFRLIMFGILSYVVTVLVTQISSGRNCGGSRCGS